MKGLTIRKRIFYSNTFMVLASLVILLGVSGILISLFKDEFLNWYGSSSKLAEHTFEVQQMMHEPDALGTDWNQWSARLSDYDFRLLTAADQNKIYDSGLKHGEWESVESLLYSAEEAGRVDTYYIEGTTVVSTLYVNNGVQYYLYAANGTQEGSFLGMGRGMFEMFLIVFLIIGIISIAGILLCSQIFTKLLINRILMPLNDLDAAAKRIDRGELTTAIAYKEENEFKSVCDSFDLMQEHLKEGLEKNSAYEKARTDMVSGISHDLRTPLTSVKGYIKGMMDGVANTEEKRRQYLTIAYKKACDMDSLLSKLFYYSKLETGNMPFFKQTVEMGKYLEDYVREKSQELSEKHGELSFEKKMEGDCFCEIDSEQIKRVLDNLIENSIKYGNADPLSIIISLDRNKDVLNGMVSITVSDNGQGMEEEKLPYIFEQFYRGDESRNSKHDGNGLGLFVCRYIVKEHKGTIEAYSENGLHVRITLPERKGGGGLDGEDTDRRG